MSTYNFGKKNLVITLSNGRKTRIPLSSLSNRDTTFIRGALQDKKSNAIARFAAATPNVSDNVVFSLAPRRARVGLVFDTVSDSLFNRKTWTEQYSLPYPRGGMFIPSTGVANANALVAAEIQNKVTRLVNATDANDVTETFDLKRMRLEDIINGIRNRMLISDRIIVATYDDVDFFTISDRVAGDLTNANFISDAASGGVNQSDSAALYGSFINDTITLISKPKKLRTRPTGAFFPYLNLTKFDFSRYGIWSKFDSRNYKNNCLYDALVASGVDDDKKSKLKTIIREFHVPVIKLSEIASVLDICISLSQWDNASGRRKEKKIGDKTKTVHSIALYSQHYFVFDKYPITTYCLENYARVCDEDNCETIIGYRDDEKRYKKNSTSKIDSLTLVRTLVDNKSSGVLLSPITDMNEMMKTRFYDNVCDIDSLSLKYDVDLNTRATTTYDVDNSEYYKVWFDFETYVDKSKGNEHVPYLVCWTTEEDGDDLKKIRSARGPNCAREFISRLPSKKKIMLIAHNLGYDYRFLFPHLYKINPITRGTGVLCCNALAYVRGNKTEIVMHDSYALITMPLSKFGSTFALEQGKEVMPYDIYNKMTTYGCTSVSINDCKVKLNKLNKTDDDILADEALLEENIKSWGCLKPDGNVDIMKYSERYCKIDCMVLRNGYVKFRKWMKELTNIDIDNKVSIASLAHEYLVKQGCYDDVLSLSGMPQVFIQKCVVGGRTMTARNKMYHITKSDRDTVTNVSDDKVRVTTKSSISDFDAVSLYPSAMKEMPGLLKGEPRVLDVSDDVKNKLKSYDGYFIQIVITRVGINRAFPLMSYIGDGGVRNFTNDMVGKTMYVDRFTLEDLILYHDIDYTVTRGYYFDSGRNTKVNDVMQHLFNARLQKKKEKNPSQIVYKLIMNSAYGKSILKPIDTRVVTVPKKDIDKFCQYNYHNIKSWTNAGNVYIAKLYKPINNHFNNAQVGTEILSYSKRLMNRVMCLAEDEGYSIYYQDTDSMHIETDNIAPLAASFKKKYGWELIGKQMGQFHSDFELGKCNEVVSTEAVFLGKKCYIDSLVGENGDTGYHVRMKGISEKSLRWTANNKFNGDVLSMYKNLFNGHGIDFDMTCGGLAANFEFTSGMKIKTRSQFNRRIQFSRGYDAPI